MENKKRLIDANPIVKFIMDGLNNPDKLKALGHDAIEVLAEIEYAPTVDAVEVVHAYWTGGRFNPMTGEYEEYCSHCCAWSSEYGKPYRPNCGAKMDGGNEDV